MQEVSQLKCVVMRWAVGQFRRIALDADERDQVVKRRVGEEKWGDYQNQNSGGDRQEGFTGKLHGYGGLSSQYKTGGDGFCLLLVQCSWSWRLSVVITGSAS